MGDTVSLTWIIDGKSFFADGSKSECFQIMSEHLGYPKELAANGAGKRIDLINSLSVTDSDQWTSFVHDGQIIDFWLNIDYVNIHTSG